MPQAVALFHFSDANPRKCYTGRRYLEEIENGDKDGCTDRSRCGWLLFCSRFKGKIRRESVGDRRGREKGAAGTRRVMDQRTAVFPMCEDT